MTQKIINQVLHPVATRIGTFTAGGVVVLGATNEVADATAFVVTSLLLLLLDATSEYIFKRYNKGQK